MLTKFVCTRCGCTLLRTHAEDKKPPWPHCLNRCVDKRRHLVRMVPWGVHLRALECNIKRKESVK
jgi:hypothetical protein